MYEELEFDAGHFSVFENAIDMVRRWWGGWVCLACSPACAHHSPSHCPSTLTPPPHHPPPPQAHIHYLHSFGNAGKPVIEGMEATADAFSVTATFTIHNSPVNAFWSLFQVGG